jgi:hypothetical protein
MALEEIAPLGAAMHGDACGLVQHEHQCVPMKKAGLEVFRRHAGQAIERVQGKDAPTIGATTVPSTACGQTT